MPEQFSEIQSQTSGEGGAAQPSHVSVMKCLKYIDKWREYFFQEWLRTAWSSQDTSRIAAAADSLVALGLVTVFIKQRVPEGIPDVGSLPSDGRDIFVSTLCHELAARSGNPLLTSVLTSVGYDDKLTVPQAILKSPWLDRISDAARILSVPQMPLSFFGEYHQLCVGRPLEATLVGSRSVRGARRYDFGIHYTPAPIVEFLVRQTVGPLLDAPGTGRQLRILDPSCGCGLFLQTALRYMAGRPATPAHAAAAVFALLERCFHGADIDAGAVAWARRLLHLAAWETLLAKNPVALPPLTRSTESTSNICRADFLSEYACPDASGSELVPFDAIIGGPPFVRLRHLYKTQPEQIERYRQTYASAQEGQFDLYMLFIEKAISLLADGGRLGFSVSNTFLRSASGQAIRRIIADRCEVEQIVEFEDSAIYPSALTQIALIVLRKGKGRKGTRHVWVKGKGGVQQKLLAVECPTPAASPLLVIRDLPASACSDSQWQLETETETTFLKKLANAGQRLGDLPVELRQGLSTGIDSVFLLTLVDSSSGRMQVKDRSYGDVHEIETAAVRPIIRGRDIRGYAPARWSSVCLFPFDDEGNVLPAELFQERFPLAYRYVQGHEAWLKSKRAESGTPWYAPQFRALKSHRRSPRLISGAIDAGCGFTLTQDLGLLCGGSVVTIWVKPDGVDPYFLLGLLNSAVFWRYAQFRTPTMGLGRHVYRLSALRDFPVPVIAGANVAIAEKIAHLAAEITTAPSRSEAEERRQQIDQLVQALYGVRDLA